MNVCASLNSTKGIRGIQLISLISNSLVEHGKRHFGSEMHVKIPSFYSHSGKYALQTLTKI